MPYLQNEIVCTGETKWAKSQMISKKETVEEKNPQTIRFCMVIFL